jgi:trehalose/maltose hydrolase-like predicted phosphorylase
MSTAGRHYSEKKDADTGKVSTPAPRSEPREDARKRGESAAAPGAELGRGDGSELALKRRFEAAVFDWGGTAVADDQADASRLRELSASLLDTGFDLAVITGSHVDSIDRQLDLRPHGPGRIIVACNRGSEVYELTPVGPVALERRVASAHEEALLDRSAKLTVERLAQRGLAVSVVSDRLNRRKIDLIPLPEWIDPPKARLPELLAAVEARLAEAGIAGLSEAVELARACALEAGLPDPRVISDAKHVEIGLTDKTDSARYVFAWLVRRGVRPEQILLAGDEFGPLGDCPGPDSLLLVPEGTGAVAVSVGAEPGGTSEGVLALGGGPDVFHDLLSDQLRRRLDGDLPEFAADEGWQIVVDEFGGPGEATRESVLTIADGRVGTRGTLLSGGTGAPPVLVGGHYAGHGPQEEILAGPVWNQIRSARGERVRRVLDLRTGTLRYEIFSSDGSGLRALLFHSLEQPGTAVLRATGSDRLLASSGPLVAPKQKGTETRFRKLGDVTLAESVNVERVVAVARERREPGKLDRLVAYGGCELGPLAALRSAGESGFERLYADQRERWGSRWADADVVIEGDPELQVAVRFSLFQLMAATADTGESAVGAGALSGSRYRGHVFWDTDVFTLPFLAATHSESARAILRYRLNRLEAARAAAAAGGRKGARFPWESTRSGLDVTPKFGRLPNGQIVPIRTGRLEEHITSDVAWAADCYLAWTGDADFAAEAQAIFIEAARYWTSRIRLDSTGSGHIYGVIGPDEYHEPVDDSCFTNVMARWTLRRAARSVRELPRSDVEEAEVEAWLAAADCLVDCYDPSTGIYEEFAGFLDLEPLIAADLAERPFAGESIVPIDRLRHSQIVKQADVVLLHHLVPEEVVERSLEPNLSFYEPRTSHGSSLSPATFALLFARAGALEQAERYLRMAAAFDLENRNQTTGSGLHTATMGGVWQALAYGFAGLRPCGEVLAVDPHLPLGWRALELSVRFQGTGVHIRAEHERTLVWADKPVSIAAGAGRVAVDVGPSGVELRPDDQAGPACSITAVSPAEGIPQSLRRSIRGEAA